MLLSSLFDSLAFCKVMVSAKEEPDLHLSPAMDALLRVHKQLVDLDTDPAHAVSGAMGTITTRILVADIQAGSLIGKHGSTIKSIQDASNCTIRVLGAGNLAKYYFHTRMLHVFSSLKILRQCSCILWVENCICWFFCAAKDMRDTI